MPRKKGKQLTDKERKLIIASFAEIGTYAGTARKHGVAGNTVKRVVQGEPEIANIVNRKKEENTKTVLDYMDSKTKQATTLVDKLLKEMAKDEKLKASSLPQLATTMGIIIDKFTMRERLNIEHKNNNLTANEIIGALSAKPNKYISGDTDD